MKDWVGVGVEEEIESENGIKYVRDGDVSVVYCGFGCCSG